MNIKNIFNDNFVQGILTGVILTTGGYLLNKLKSWHKRRQEKFDYVWQPVKPIINDFSDIKNIKEYKKSPRMTITENGFGINSRETVEGMDAFKQYIITLLNTENEKYEIYEGGNYGVSYLITRASNKEEFALMSNVVAKEIMKTNIEWIKEVFFIKKIKNKNIVILGLGLKGINEIVEIEVPIRLK